MTLSKRSRSELFSLIRLFAEIQHFLREWARSDRNNCRLTGRTLEQNRARRWAAICLVPAQTEDCRFCSSFFHQSLKEGLLQGHTDLMISDVTMWVLSWDRRSATEDAYSQTFITNCDVNLCFFSHEKGEIKDYKSLMLTKMYFNLPVSVSELFSLISGALTSIFPVWNCIFLLFLPHMNAPQLRLIMCFCTDWRFCPSFFHCSHFKATQNRL